MNAPEHVPEAHLNLQAVLAGCDYNEETEKVPSRATPVRSTVLDPEERRKQAMAQSILIKALDNMLRIQVNKTKEIQTQPEKPKAQQKETDNQQKV